MSVSLPSQDRGALGFGEKLLTLLDTGSFTATYKYAVLLALVDLCLEHSSRSGAAPDVLTTRQLADKVLEVYWPHTAPFAGGGEDRILLQNTGGQAEIVSLIRRFREREVRTPLATLAESRAAAPEGFRRLVDHIEWKLVEMPLPRLQMFGNRHDPFIYQIAWDASIRQGDMHGSDFDNRLHLLDGAGDHLVRLAGLLRPLVQRQWAAMVSRLNRDRLQDSALEEFLFGATRISLERVRDPLRELQDERCFYCGERLRATPEVDHFLPWARYPDNGIENLVVADRACNNSKRDFLAASAHLDRWRERFTASATTAAQLQEIAESRTWDRHPERTLSVARAIYLRLPEDAKLWAGRREFVDLDRGTLETLLGGAA